MTLRIPVAALEPASSVLKFNSELESQHSWGHPQLLFLLQIGSPLDSKRQTKIAFCGTPTSLKISMLSELLRKPLCRKGVHSPSRRLSELCTSLQYKSYSASGPDNTRRSGIKLPEGPGLGLFILCPSHGSLPPEEELESGRKAACGSCGKCRAQQLQMAESSWNQEFCWN